MKKLLSMALALFMVAGLLAGCGGSGSSTAGNADAGNTADTTADAGDTDTDADAGDADEDAAPAADGDKTTLTWAMWDLDTTIYYRPLAEAYVAKNPNVEIEFIDLGSADYSVMLATQLAGGADIDIITNKEIPYYSNLISQGHLEPVNLDDFGLNADDYAGVIEELTWEGELYAIPFRSEFWLIYYNKDLFDAAGVDYPTNDMTFDEYIELSKTMTSGDGSDKVYGTHFHTWWSTVQHFAYEDPANSVINTNYDFLKPYYETALSLQDEGYIMDYATLKTSGTHYSGVFYNEQIAMMHMGGWFIATQIEKVKTGESLAENWGIVAYPGAEGQPAGTAPASITSISVNANSSNKEQALDFIAFVGGPEGAEVMANTGNFPALMTDDVVDTISSIDGFPTDENSKAALIPNRTTLELPLNEYSSQILEILETAHDDIMTGNESLDDAIAALNEKAEELLG